MAVVSMKQLLEAGVHFGHQTRRWNPKMKKYIYSARNDIHIIDLQQTVQLAEEAYNFVREIAAEGKSVLFVGTKKQAQALGWQGGSLEPYAPGCSIGGDRFGNYEGTLPDGSYHECDLNTRGADKRGAERLVYADDGRIYYTADHYESFEEITE